MISAHKILVLLGDILLFFDHIKMKRRDILLSFDSIEIVLYSISLD
jgi:hypothetical protein